MDTTPSDARKPGLWEQLAAAPVCTLLIAVNVVVFTIAETHGGTTTSENLLRFGANWRGDVWAGERWRLLTSMFLHIGPVHLVWNAVMGFRWSAPVERELGKWRFLVLYLTSGIAGSAASVVGHDAVGAGASGALFGVVAARLILWRRPFARWPDLWAQPVVRNTVATIGLWFVVGAYAGFDNYAHAGGLLFGGLLTWAFERRPSRWPLLAAASVLVLVIAGALQPLPFVHEHDRQIWNVYKAGAAKDWERVLAATEPLAHAQPADPRVLELRTRALLELGRPSEALPLAQERAKQRDVDGYINLAWTYEYLHQDREALRELGHVLELDPSDTWALEARMRIRFTCWQLDEARDDAKALLMQKDSAWAHATLSEVALRQQSTTSALPEIDRAIALDPGEPAFAHIRAIAQAVGGDTKGALVTLEALASKTPQPAHTAFTAAYVRAAGGDARGGWRECEDAKADAELDTLCGWLKVIDGDAATARARFERANTWQPGAGATAGLALLALRSGDEETANDSSLDALTLDENNAEALMVRAEVQLARGDEAGAWLRWNTARQHAWATWVQGRAASERLRSLTK